MHTLLNLLSKGRAKAIGSLLCLLLTSHAFATDYYVALPPAGSNNNNGRSESAPFATIQRAADMAGDGDVVYVMAGTYREQVEIKSNGVTFRPYGDDLVTINGTDLMRNWTRFGNTKTYQTTMDWDVDANWGSNQLFQDGKMIELARWPKQISDDIIKPNTAKAKTVTATGNTFTIIDPKFDEPAERWIGAQIWVNTSRAGYDGQGWTGTVSDVSGNTIIVDFGQKPTLGDQAYGLGEDTEYFLFNPTRIGVNAVTGGVDALLEPGEWWKDDVTNILYVKTREEEAPNNNPNWDGTGGNVIEAKRRQFAFFPAVGNRWGYTIQDFHLFACAIRTDRAAKDSRRIVEEAHDIILSGLQVKYPSHQTNMRGNPQGQHYSWTGIVLSGRNNVIRDCDISLSATSAISFVGAGNKMLNNRIHDTNYMCSNAGAVNTSSLCKDAEIAYNTIWNTTMMAINLVGGQNSNPEVRHVYRVHHNEIFDFMRRSYDSGAIDMVGRDLQWGRIDHNRIYNTLDDAKIGNRKYGIYLDYGSGSQDWRIRATVDHNVLYEVNNPMTVNTGADVHIFNNVFLSVEEVLGDSKERTRSLSINLDLSKGPKVGENIKVYNNILSEAPAFGNGSQGRVSLLNNLTNAKGGVLNELFVDATNPNLGARDYQLKSTATAAIDQGISVDEYTSNYALDRPVAGITDMGAFEYPASSISADTQAPSVPSVASFVVSEKTATAFRLRWNASTDNVKVAYYEVYANGTFVNQTANTNLLLTNLTPSSSYFVTVRAVDASGNRSRLSSNPLEVKTTLSHVSIPKTSTPPTMDGSKEAIWTQTPLSIAKVYTAVNRVPPTSPADLSGEWTSLWDANNLYLFIDVNDDASMVDSPNWWNDDHIEIFIDADGTWPSSYTNDGKQYQFAVKRGSNTMVKGKGGNGSNAASIQVVNVEKPNHIGYRVEVRIPFTSLGTGVTAQAFKFMGIDVQIGDDDDGDKEDTRMGWFSPINNVDNDPSLMAIAQLVEQGNVDNVKPLAPTGLQVSALTPNQFILIWNASSDNIAVQSYEVFLNGNLVATPTATSATLKELTPGTTYSVLVKAKDRAANLSPASLVARVTTPTLASGVKYEAEDAELAGATAFSNAESGYSGSGYVQQAATGGASVRFSVNVPTTGVYAVSLYYTRNNANGNLSCYVNGIWIKNTLSKATPSANDWVAATDLLNLTAGDNTITYRYEPANGNTGQANLDYLLLYPSPGANSQVFNVPTVMMEKWDNVSGRTVSAIPVNTQPSSTYTLTSLESTVRGDRYGVRIRGYIVPTTTADYTFFIASDDNGAFWLSSDDQPANKGTAPIASVPGWTPARTWNRDPLQRSAPRRLQAGVRYYFEALMKEESDNDNLAVGWTTTPGLPETISVISGQYLARYEECPTCRQASIAVESKPESQSEDLPLRLRPNPASREVTIDLSGFAQESAVQVKMMDMSGKVFVREQIPLVEGIHQVTLPVSQLPQGLFVVRVQGSKTAKTAKLVIAP